MYMVMDTPNLCLPEGERFVLLKKGVLLQALAQELRRVGLILEPRNLVICSIARPVCAEGWEDRSAEEWGQMPTLEETADNDGAGGGTTNLLRVVPPTRQDVLDWEVATQRRYFPEASLLVMLRLQFIRDDLPVDETLADVLHRVIKTLNASLLDATSAVHNDLRPRGQLEVILPPEEEAELPNHDDFTTSVAYQKRIAETQEKRHASHVKMVSTLHDLRQMQTEMIQAVKAGQEWRHRRAAYQQTEAEVLRECSKQVTTHQQCSEEESQHTRPFLTSNSLQNRAQASDIIDVLSVAHKSLAGLKEWHHAPLPSEQQKRLRRTQADVTLSSFQHAEKLRPAMAAEEEAAASTSVRPALPQAC